jgi:hypothetical protein
MVATYVTYVSACRLPVFGLLIVQDLDRRYEATAEWCVVPFQRYVLKLLIIPQRPRCTPR